MPELPEVETIACGVHDRVHGERITEVWFGAHPEPMKTGPVEQALGLEDRRIERVYRVGKHIVCDLVRNPDEAAATEGAPVVAQWIVHLGMTGRLLVTAPGAPLADHTHARLTLADGREIRFVDPRRFGRLELRDLRRDTPFAGPGREPLTISVTDFVGLFRLRRTAIKAALLNQSLLHGVGNIYADESLFRAGIRPRRMASRLRQSELEGLHQALKEVLLHAIALGGSSVSDYVDANGVKGFFQLEHQVYQRGGQGCLVCGARIRKIVVGGRGTHFCPKCQH